ncbi:MAG: GLUG motif-containing protein [Bacilli bacterium]
MAENSIIYAMISFNEIFNSASLNIDNIVPLGWIGITNATELNSIKENLEADYIVMNDIDLSNGDYKEWEPIIDFSGTLDGNGKIIKGLSVTIGLDNVGFIGKTSGPPTIKNIRFTDVNIKGKNFVGSLIGETVNEGTVIDNVSVKRNITGTSYVGGLIGLSKKSSTIKNSYNNINITATSYYIGGIIGYLKYTTIKNVYSSGAVKGYLSHSTVNLVMGYVSGLTKENLYWIMNSTGDITSRHASLIESIDKASVKSSYEGFDFENIWDTIEGETTPYIKGIMIDEKNYLK